MHVFPKQVTNDKSIITSCFYTLKFNKPTNLKTNNQASLISHIIKIITGSVLQRR